MRTLLSALMLSCLAMAGATTTSTQSAGYEDIQIQVGLEQFVLTPTPALTVHGIGGASPDGGTPDLAAGASFSFADIDPPTLRPMVPEQANKAWRALSKSGLPHAVAFTYYMNCSSDNQLPSSLTGLCDVPLLQQDGLFNIRGNEPGREVGTHLDRPTLNGRPGTVPVAKDGSMIVREDGRSYWEGQLPTGPTAFLCDKRGAAAWYQCTHVRALTPTTSYRLVFMLASEDPAPSDAEWLSYSASIESILLEFQQSASSAARGQTH
jgi:hypothetical protein